MKEKLIDLHLHLDGSLSVASVRKLAAMQNIPVPEQDSRILEQLQVNENCKSLEDYLQKFSYALSFLQTAEAVEESVYILLEELKELGLIYAEIRFAPQLHREQGLIQEEVVQAALRGQKRSKLRSNLILCCMRGLDTHEENMETVRLAGKYLHRGVCALDLAGAEAPFPTHLYKKEFELAKTLQIPITIHAGEAAGPESIREALALGADRIGHGVRAAEDTCLLIELAEQGTTLELCPTSNLDTHVYEHMEEYPIRKLMEAGVRLTVNSDDMAVSGTNVKKELDLMRQIFNLSEAEILEIKKNAVSASFADEKTKKYMMEELENGICISCDL